MTVDIINTEYYQNTLLKRIIKKMMFCLVIVYILFLICDWFIVSLDTYIIYKDILFGFLMLLLLIDVLSKNLYTRIGKVEITDTFLNIQYEKTNNRIDLTTIDKVKLKRENYGFYKLIISEQTVVVELSQYTKSKLKSIFKKNNIKIN